MAREIFKNLPDTTTPLNATKLNRLFNGEEAMGSIVVDDISSKNIFDGLLELGSFDGNTGLPIDSSAVKRNVNSILVKPNEPYILSQKGVWASARFYFYTKEKTYISNVKPTSSFTTPNNCYYVNFISDAFASDETGIQLEKGSVITENTPYINFRKELTDVTDKFVINSDIAELSTTYTSKIFRAGNIVWMNLYLTLKNPTTSTLASTNVGSVSGSIIPPIGIVDKCMISTADQSGWNFNVTDGQVNISSSGAITVRNSSSTTSTKKFIGINLIYFV